MTTRNLEANMRIHAIAAMVLAGAASTAAAKDTVGLSVSTLNNPFFVTLRDGAKAAADKAGLALIVFDAQDKVDKQVADIEDLVQKKVKVILINPTDSAAVVPAIRRANAAGVPVITVDRGAAGGDVAFHIASDNVAGGKLAGELVCKVLGGKGKAVELEGIPGSSAARDRGQGFHEALKTCPGVSVVARQSANFDRAQGLSVTENVLQAQPAVDAIFAHNDEMALGALRAAKASNRRIRIVGFDATDDAMKALKSCELVATVAQQPAQMGRLAVEKAAAIIKGSRLAHKTEFIPVALKLVTNQGCK
jgi:ribose transport system substrate-binding protein